jgi:hypothetical protein
MAQIKDDEDAYEYLDDEQYRKMVEDRRKMGDFVVGDSECWHVRF